MREPQEVLNEVYDLFIDLDADESVLEFPVIYTNGKAGTATMDLNVPGTDLQPLFELIFNTIPAAPGTADGDLQVLVTNLDYSDYLGRLAIGRVFNGTWKAIGDTRTRSSGGSNEAARTSPVRRRSGPVRAFRSSRGVPLDPLSRILTVVDSANGVSGVLPFARWLFVPPTLSIALQRHAWGDWVCLDAWTALGPDGLGVTTFTLADRRGYLGGGTQALLVEQRA